MRFFMARGSIALAKEDSASNDFTLAGNSAVQSVPFDKKGFACTSTMCLEDIDCLHWVLDVSSEVD